MSSGRPASGLGLAIDAAGWAVFPSSALLLVLRLASALRPGDPHRRWFPGRGASPPDHLPIGRVTGPAPILRDLSPATSGSGAMAAPRGWGARLVILAAGSTGDAAHASRSGPRDLRDRPAAVRNGGSKS